MQWCQSLKKCKLRTKAYYTPWPLRPALHIIISVYRYKLFNIVISIIYDTINISYAHLDILLGPKKYVTHSPNNPFTHSLMMILKTQPEAGFRTHSFVLVVIESPRYFLPSTHPPQRSADMTVYLVA